MQSEERHKIGIFHIRNYSPWNYKKKKKIVFKFTQQINLRKHEHFSADPILLEHPLYINMNFWRIIRRFLISFYN